MQRFDLRTRLTADAGAVDVERFLDVEVPRAIERNGALAARAMAATGLESITISVDGVDSTWRVIDGRLVVDRSDTGRARADLSSEWFTSIVTDTRSALAVMVAGDPVMTRGRITHLMDWEIALRALLDGRPAHEPGLVRFVDRDGTPLDLTRTFTIDDDVDEMRHFLAEAGFLHVRGVFDDDSLEAVDAAITERRGSARRDDATTWWARVDGLDDEVCVRFNDLDDDELPAPLGAMTAPIAAITDSGHEFDHIDVLMKPVGVVEGVSDLPWHKDCSLGLHTHQCARVVTGASITASGPDNGQLGVVAGSHRVNLGQFSVPEDLDLPIVWIETDPGDVTVHLSCTLHCSTPPLHSERRVAYVTWRLPGDSEALADTVRKVRDQAGRDTFSPKEGH